jgi:hypothetical protein
MRLIFVDVEQKLSCKEIHRGWKLPLEFKSWIARIGTPPARVAALQAVFAELPSEVREYFQIGPELSFVTDSAWMEAPKIG